MPAADVDSDERFVLAVGAVMIGSGILIGFSTGQWGTLLINAVVMYFLVVTVNAPNR